MMWSGDVLNIGDNIITYCTDEFISFTDGDFVEAYEIVRVNNDVELEVDLVSFAVNDETGEKWPKIISSIPKEPDEEGSK